MFNSGVRGKRAPDNFGTVTSQTQFVQQQSPQPSITGWSISGSDDTALDTAGGQTVLVNGTGFASGAAVTVNGQTISPVTVVSPTELSFTSIALAGGSYSLIVYNSTGGAAILVPGLIYSAVPTWTTSAGSIGTTYETTPISTSVVATSDSAITYSLSSGSLPTGATLYANGVITGTSPVESGSTTYTFAIKAEDAELQDTTRTFTLTINTDVVTWSSPANNTTYTANINEVASNVVLSATSAAGYGITYSANTLPTGLSLAGNTISGTPTVVANSSTLLTATASTTNRSATRTINWIIQLGSDPYFNLTTLLLNGEASSNYWIQDASTNKFALTVNADARPAAFSPYETVWSNYFDGSGDYLTVPANAAFLFPGDHTIECWITWDGTYSAAGREIYATGGSGSADQFGIFSGSGLFYAGLSSGYTPPTNVWTHIAISRSGSAIRFFGNGVLQFTGTNGSSIGSNSATVHIGIRGDGFHPWLGYISNLRIVKGTALYIENFIPSTSPLTAISGTSLLTCQSNRLLDNSTNTFAVTKNGDVTVSNFAPFTGTDLVTGSSYFDGTGDYLSLGANSAFGFGTSDFTVEFWIYMTSRPGTWRALFDIGDYTTGILMRDQVTSDSLYLAGTSYDWMPNTYLILNQWNHVALTRSGTSLKVFVNGSTVLSATNSSNLGSSQDLFIGEAQHASGQTWPGYISNFRIVKGTALYTANFTPPTIPLTAVANTSLLTLQNRFGENNNRFVDTSGMNSIVTKFANATQGTFTPFSQTGWSNYFDGTTDSLTQATNTSYGFGTGNFTIEFWLYLNSTGLQTVYSHLTSASSTNPHIYVSGSIRYYTASADRITGSSLNTSQWYHIALSRASGSTRLFIDGTQSGSTYTDGNDYGSTAPLGIGTYWDGGSPVTSNTLFGYMSNLRVVKGSAVYTSTFTLPTAPLTAITNTSLLTCQSNRFIDNSANNFTLTRNGDTSIQAFSPFSPAIITPTSYSGYFDGSDNLTTPSNNAFTYGTSDFTIEGWFYFTGGVGPSGYSYLFAQGANTTATSLGVYIQSGVFRIWNGSAVISSTASFVQNIWTHIAVTRFGTSMRLFVNGNLEGTVTNNNNITTGSTTGISIGRWSEIGDANYITGYVSNFRVVNGTALYTASFTPSITPLTAVSGTSLLACQSNRFIDNSINNFTITAVGDARPTQFNPFGNTSLTGADAAYSVANVGGSIYFDGTGDYLTATTSFNTSGTWTIEGWCYFTSSANSDVLLNASSDRLYIQWIGTTFYLGDANINNISFASKPINTWFHIAVVKNSNTYTVYFNGVVMGTSTTALTTDTVTTWQIGARTSQSIVARGYISNLRVIAGVALYTSAFAPPVAPLTSIAGSTLLLNSTNSGLIDYTGKNILETVGTTSISITRSKFENGSIYLPGSTSYLKMSNTYVLTNFSTGNFTIECWIYYVSSSQPTFPTLFNTGSNDGGTSGTMSFYINHPNAGGGGTLYYWAGSGGTYVNYGSLPDNNAWNHLAIVRYNGTVSYYLNGVSRGTPRSITNSLTSSTNTMMIGATPDGGNNFVGYVDDFRVTNGYARYTSNFTPPTSAFITF